MALFQPGLGLCDGSLGRSGDQPRLHRGNVCNDCSTQPGIVAGGADIVGRGGLHRTAQNGFSLIS